MTYSYKRRRGAIFVIITYDTAHAYPCIILIWMTSLKQQCHRKCFFFYERWQYRESWFKGNCSFLKMKKIAQKSKRRWGRRRSHERRKEGRKDFNTEWHLETRIHRRISWIVLCFYYWRRISMNLSYCNAYSWLTANPEQSHT